MSTDPKTAPLTQEEERAFARLESGFMRPNIVRGSFARVDEDLCRTNGHRQLVYDGSFWIEREYLPDALDGAPESECVDETADAWFAELSAPGYLDRTGWSGPYASEVEAVRALLELYGDDFDDGDASEDEEPTEPTEPDPGDYVIRSDGFRLHVGIVDGKFLGTFGGEGDEARARQAIRAHTNAGHFWPSVWTESDHGNLELESFDYTEGA